ncbi:NAD(P)/FAD-dependent oxidoreductase [Wandonia haliotis]|uniref:NAD(P)/FAD-dependent oxidoreductase n=1 Tax=Wandonia haliotis TaxID=574963 RepID=A0ABN1MKA9_9FLAO
MTEETDILIIGGGIAGCISAMFLCEKYSVCIIDKPDQQVGVWGESLVPSSKRIFKELGIYNQICALDTTICTPSIGVKSYWGSENPVYSDALRNPEGEGWSIDKPAFVRELRKITNQYPVQWLEGRLHKLNEREDFWEVYVSGNEKRKIRAKFLIDASGRTNVLRKKLNLNRVKKDQQICISVTVKKTDDRMVSTILPEASGWWYCSPLPDKDRILVSFYTDADLLDKAATKDTAFILQKLQSNTLLQSQLEIKGIIDPRFLGTRAAGTNRLENIGRKNWIAIGDAAMCFDPLSSQGMYNAMVMAAQTAKQICSIDFICDPEREKVTRFYTSFYESSENIWLHYLKHYNLFYAMEKRWENEPYWERRQRKIPSYSREQV